MKFKSSVFTQVSGSVGGLTYAHNQNGMYVRSRAVPTNPLSPAQQTIREAMADAQVAWKALSAGARTAWNAYAAGTPVTDSLGNSQHLTGLAMFLRQHVSRYQTGQTPITVGPSTMGLSGLNDLAVAQHLAQDAYDVSYDPASEWAITTGGYMAVYQSPPKSPTVNFYKGPFKFAGVLPGSTGAPPASPFFVGSLYALVSGQRYFLRVIAVDSEGRMSAEQFLILDVP